VTKKKRMGDDPFEWIPDAKEEKAKPRKKALKEGEALPPSEILSMEERLERGRQAAEMGIAPSLYINKKGELMQKILLHLPFERALVLRDEAYNSMPRKSLSEVIREKLK